MPKSNPSPSQASNVSSLQHWSENLPNDSPLRTRLGTIEKMKVMEESAALTKAFPMRMNLIGDENIAVEATFRTIVDQVKTTPLTAEELWEYIEENEGFIELEPNGKSKSKIKELDAKGVKLLAEHNELKETAIYVEIFRVIQPSPANSIV